MIEALVLCGVGVLAGSLLMLAFFPLIHRRMGRLTRRDTVAGAPVAVNEIQADKDQLRAQFAMSVRRLEINIEEMRAKTVGRHSEVGRSELEIKRLHDEIDKKTALIVAMRARERARKKILRTAVKIATYVVVRSHRQRQQETFEEMLGQISRRA